MLPKSQTQKLPTKIADQHLAFTVHPASLTLAANTSTAPSKADVDAQACGATYLPPSAACNAPPIGLIKPLALPTPSKPTTLQNSRSRQRRKRHRRKRHPQPRAHHIQIRRQTRHASRDQALEGAVDDAVEGREGVEAADAVHGEPGPGDEGDAEEDWANGVEGAEFVGEEGGDDAEGEAVFGGLVSFDGGGDWGRGGW